MVSRSYLLVGLGTELHSARIFYKLTSVDRQEQMKPEPATPAPSFRDIFGRVAQILGSSSIVLVSLLNVLDWITSVIGYGRGEAEANPITLQLTDRFGDYV